MTHRPPTRFDIGRQVEVSDDGDGAWRERELYMIGNDYVRIMLPDGGVESWRFCRVPYTTPDPIAELSAAADWLAERGQDEAASILLKAVTAMNEGQDIIGKCPLGIHFEAPYLQQDFSAWRDYMLRTTPEPQP